jgi:hypothetical protein
MQKNYMIAICDILGFKNLVNTYSLNVLTKHHIGNFIRSFHHSIHKNDFPVDVLPSLIELTDQSNLGIAWFSDTILIYTLEDTNDCIKNLFVTLGWLLFETNTYGNIHLRCGISYGEAYLDLQNSLFVGKPIIDAYMLEQKQQWSGGALTESAINRLPSYVQTGDIPDWYLVRYNVPLKENIKLNTLAIDWTLGIHQSVYKLKWKKGSDEPSESDWKENPDICEKWYNSNKFHDDVCKFCKKEY